MLTQLVRYFIPDNNRRNIAQSYAELVDASRNNYFFAECGVPDTLDGRFEMIVIFMFLEMCRLKAQGNNEKHQLILAEAFFDDMDRNLRELGVGDTGVSHRIKKMAGAFYGRLNVYDESWSDDTVLQDALRRNVYGTLSDDEIDDAMVKKLLIKLREYES